VKRDLPDEERAANESIEREHVATRENVASRERVSLDASHRRAGGNYHWSRRRSREDGFLLVKSADHRRRGTNGRRKRGCARAIDKIRALDKNRQQPAEK